MGCRMPHCGARKVLTQAPFRGAGAQEDAVDSQHRDRRVAVQAVGGACFPACTQLHCQYEKNSAHREAQIQTLSAYGVGEYLQVRARLLGQVRDAFRRPFALAHHRRQGLFIQGVPQGEVPLHQVHRPRVPRKHDQGAMHASSVLLSS